MRFEYKYLVSEELLPEIRRKMAPYVYLDQYGTGYEERGYTVRSIYFDTLRLSAYHEKVEGLKNRIKLRVRSYNKPAEVKTVFLEIKRKDDQSCSKSRAPVRFEGLPGLLATGDIDRYAQPGTRNQVNSFLFHLYASVLRPTNLVVYEREAFLSHFDNTVRITYDRNLRGMFFPGVADLFKEEGMEYAIPGRFILEVKFNTHFPEWLKPVLARYGLVQRSLSKYVMCMDLGTTLRKDKAALIARIQPVTRLVEPAIIKN